MSSIWLGLIVEGHGDGFAAPSLIYRLAAQSHPEAEIIFSPPIRKRRNQVVRPGELERAVQLGASTLRGPGGLLVLLDADEDCPAELGPGLLQRAQVCAPHIPIEVVIAKVMYENWFLAAAESLRGRCGLPDDLRSPESPESVRGAKGWLQRHMPPDRAYSETTDQKRLTASLDLNQAASRSPSFAKLVRAVDSLVAAASSLGAQG
jgi:hypothetical protein